MKRQSLRSLGVFVLSLIFLHSSVWGMLEKCLQTEHESVYTHAEQEHDPQTLHQHSDFQDPSLPIIHCTPVTQQIGPAVLADSVKLGRSDKSFTLQTVSLSTAVAAVLRNDLWLEAVFRRTIAISLPIDLARHLFLSVLQI